MTNDTPDREAMRQWQRDALAEAIERNPVLPPADRKRIAQRMHQLLQDAAGSTRGTRTEIARRTWPNEPVPLKKLDRLTLPPDTVPSPKRLERLVGKPRDYAALAATIAEFLERRREDLQLDLFRGTRLDADVTAQLERFVDTHSADWERLADLIHGMADAISRRVDLQDYLKVISGRLGTYSLETRTVRPSSSFLLPHGPLANGYEVGEEFPPIPSVPLVGRRLAAPFARSLRLQAEDQVEHSVHVTVNIRRDVRLAIGPADDRETPRPLFEIRTSVELEDDTGHDWAARHPWFYLDGSTEQFPCRGSNGDTFAGEIALGITPGAQGRWVPLLEDDADPVSSPVRQWEHVYAVWRPVTARSCAELLNMQVTDGRAAISTPSGGGTGHSFLANDIAGGWVEAAITDGDHALEQELEAEAERLKQLIHEHILHIRSEADARHQQSWSRWQASSTEEEQGHE